MSTLLTEIDPDMLMLICRHWATLLTVLGSDWLFCRLCWLWLTLIWICVTLSTVIDSDWPMVFYTVIDPVWPMCRFWLLQTTLNLPCVDSFDFDWHRLDPVSTMLTVIDADWNLWPCVSLSYMIAWLAHDSIFITVNHPVWLKCRICWMRLTLTLSFDDSADWGWHWSDPVSTLIDQDWRTCRLFRLKSTLICSCVHSVE